MERTRRSRLAALVGLRDLFEDADARYAAAKRERHALDFLDLELGAIRLLRDYPDVAAEVRAGFRHLMLDEAQDINPAQAELVALIAGDDGNDGPEPRPHLFLVGDAKQSIYHFRGAEVQRFGELRALATGRGGPSLPLSQSFRAHDALVDRLNELFGSVFANPSEPFDAVMESMKGRPSPPPGEAPHLVLMTVGRTTANGDRAGGDERRRVEADAVASEIAALLREQRPHREGSAIGKAIVRWGHETRSFSSSSSSTRRNMLRLSSMGSCLPTDSPYSESLKRRTPLAESTVTRGLLVGYVAKKLTLILNGVDLSEGLITLQTQMTFFAISICSVCMPSTVGTSI